jgi:UDP-glucose:(heptosyl)LPS alpha-1,3-glucosyltransferase
MDDFQPDAPPRIALMVGRFVPTLGGLESWAHDLATALAARGHPVTVLTTKTAAYPDGVRFQIVPMVDGVMPQARAFAAAAAALRGHLVHDTGIGLGADLLQPQMGCRTLNLTRETAQLPGWQRIRRTLSPRYRRYLAAVGRLERIQLRASRRVVAVSRETASVFRARYGVAEDRIRVIPNGIDISRFDPRRIAALRPAARARLGLDQDALVLLAAAVNFRLKGVHHAIAALARIKVQCPEARLLVAGAGAVAAFTAIARNQGVEDRVRFLGHVDDMPALFAAADIFVHPTAHDACSLATLEAMACGLPVITTRRNGAADGMTSGREGFVLDAPDAVTLAGSLLRLRDRTDRLAMGEAARRLAEQHDFDLMVDRLTALYAELSGPAGSPHAS